MRWTDRVIARIRFRLRVASEGYNVRVAWVSSSSAIVLILNQHEQFFKWFSPDKGKTFSIEDRWGAQSYRNITNLSLPCRYTYNTFPRGEHIIKDTIDLKVITIPVRLISIKLIFRLVSTTSLSTPTYASKQAFTTPLVSSETLNVCIFSKQSSI